MEIIIKWRADIYSYNCHYLCEICGCGIITVVILSALNDGLIIS